MSARPGTTAEARRVPGHGPAGADAAVYVRVFTVLWAIAHVAHMMRKGDPERPLMWLVLLAALLVIERPTSRWRLALMAGAQLLYAADLLPRIDNHLLIMCFVNLGLLTSVAISLWRRASADDAWPPAGALPYARLVLLVVYGAAAIAKLNDGFFDTTHSCAIGLFDDTLSVFGDGGSSVVDAVAPALPFVVAAAELAVPVLLLIPATRLLGVVATVAFHLAMTISPTSRAGIGFTFVLFALVFLFLPERSGVQVQDRVGAVTRKLGLARGSTRTVVLIGATVVICVLATREVFTFTTFSDNGNWLVTVPFMVVIGILLIDAAWQASRQRWPGTLAFRPRHFVYFLLLALVVLDAVSPYVGGKTITSFTMYSNLQTERDTSNHFFLPRVSLASGQDDLVEIISSSDPELRVVRRNNFLITWHEMRRQLTGNPTASVEYLRDGTRFSYAEARENPELVDLDPVTRRLLAYRLVDREGAGVRCRW